MLGAVVVALSSAAFFALGSGLQHRAAGSAPKASKRRMVAGLLSRPSWLIGAGACAVAFALQAVALRLGAISVVQPILLSGIVFTVLLRPVLDRRSPSFAEVGWVLLTWCGLALFILAVPRADDQPPVTGAALIMVAAGLAAVAVLALTARRVRGRALTRGLLLGCASGVLFGLVAGLLKLTAGRLEQGPLALATQWPTWVLIAVGGCAVLLNQRAYQETEMSVSTPVLNICQLLVSLAFGFVVFAEPLFSSPLGVLGELVGLTIMLFGVTTLARRAAHNGPEPAPTGASDTTPVADQERVPDPRTG